MERIKEHPVLTPEPRASVKFTFDGRECTALAGEMISSATRGMLISVSGRAEGFDPRRAAMRVRKRSTSPLAALMRSWAIGIVRRSHA